MNRALLGAALFALFAALLVLAGCSTSDSQEPTPTSTTRECVAVSLDVKTGKQTEVPAPCHTATTGCTGQITTRVEDDGTVTTSC